MSFIDKLKSRERRAGIRGCGFRGKRPSVAVRLRSESLERRDLMAGLVINNSTFDIDLFASNLQEQAGVGQPGGLQVEGYSFTISERDPSDPFGTFQRRFSMGEDGVAVHEWDNSGVELSSFSDRDQEIASISKTITAAAVLKVWQDQTDSVDALSTRLDDPIMTYLPGNWTFSTAFQGIKVRDLLRHTSGLVAPNPTSLNPCRNAGTVGGIPGGFTNNGYIYSDLQAISAQGNVCSTAPTYWTINYAFFRVALPYMWNDMPNSELDAAAAGLDVSVDNLPDIVWEQIQRDWGFDESDLDEDNMLTIGPDQLTTSAYKAYVIEYILPSTISNPQTRTAPVRPTLLYGFPAVPNVPGTNTQDRTLEVGSRGWNLSARDLEQFLTALRYDDSVLTPQTRQLMRDEYLGFRDPLTLANPNSFIGIMGDYYGHDGLNFNNAASNPALTYQSTRDNNTIAMTFPGGVQAAMLINSELGQTFGSAFDPSPGTNPTPGGNGTAIAMRDAYDNAWTELVYRGDHNIIDPDPDDIFILRRNANPDFIDLLHDGQLVFTRRTDTLHQLTINGRGGDNQYFIEYLPDDLELIIQGGSSADTVNLRGTFVGGIGPYDLDANAGGLLDFNGAGGDDTLNIRDIGEAVAGRTYTVDEDRVTRTNTLMLQYFYENVETLRLETSNQSSTVDIIATLPSTTTIVAGFGGADTINVGGADLDSIQGSVNIIGGTLFAGPDAGDAVNFYDTFSNTPHDYLFESGRLTLDDSVEIAFSAEDIALFAGSGADTVTVESLDAGQTLEINTAGGADQITIDFASLSGTVLGEIDVDGGSGIGQDSLILDDGGHRADADYTINSANVQRDGLNLATYSRIENLSVQGASLFRGNFQISGLSAPTTVTGGIRADTFNVGSINLLPIDELLTIDGGDNGAGEDTVNLRDIGGRTATYFIDDDVVTGNSFAAITLNNVEHAILDASGGNNTIEIEDALGPTRYTLNGNSGSDTFILDGGSQSLSGFNHPIIAHGGGDDDHLILHDETHLFSRTYTVTENSVDRNSFGEISPFSPGIGVTFYAMASVELLLNDNNATVNVESTNPLTEYIFRGAGGDDTLNLNRHLDGDVDADVRIDGDDIESESMDIQYYQFEQINVSLGDEINHVTVDGLNADLALNLGGESDRVSVTPTSNLSAVHDTITVDGQEGDDRLLLYDVGWGSGGNLTVTPNSVDRFLFGPLGTPGVTFDNLAEMRLFMGTGDDYVNVTGTAQETEYYLEGGAGDDTFDVVPPASRLLHLDGGRDFDILNFDAQGNPVQVGPSKIQVPNRGDTDYFNFEELNILNEGINIVIPGDTDGDGDVDIADLNNVRNNFGGVGLGDTDLDGDVDIADLNNVRNNFGATTPAAAAVDRLVSDITTADTPNPKRTSDRVVSRRARLTAATDLAGLSDDLLTDLALESVEAPR